MTIETARHIALRIWRDPEYSHVEMDVVVGEAIAHMLLWLASSRPTVSRVDGRTKFETSSVDLATDPRWKTRDTKPDAPVDHIDRTETTEWWRDKAMLFSEDITKLRDELAQARATIERLQKDLMWIREDRDRLYDIAHERGLKLDGGSR